MRLLASQLEQIKRDFLQKQHLSETQEQLIHTMQLERQGLIQQIKLTSAEERRLNEELLKQATATQLLQKWCVPLIYLMVA